MSDGCEYALLMIVEWRSYSNVPTEPCVFDRLRRRSNRESRKRALVSVDAFIVIVMRDSKRTLICLQSLHNERAVSCAAAQAVAAASAHKEAGIADS